MIQKSDTKFKFAIGSSIFTVVVSVAILIVAVLISYEFSDFAEDETERLIVNKYPALFCLDKRRLSMLDSDALKNTNENNHFGRNLADCSNYDYNINKGFFKSIKTGKTLNYAGFGLSIACSFFLLFFFTFFLFIFKKEVNRTLSLVFMIISIIALVAYALCFGFSYAKFKNIEKRSKNLASMKKYNDEHPEYLVKSLQLLYYQDYFDINFIVSRKRKELKKLDESQKEQLVAILEDLYDDFEKMPKHKDFRDNVKKTKILLFANVILSCICFVGMIVTLSVAISIFKEQEEIEKFYY